MFSLSVNLLIKRLQVGLQLFDQLVFALVALQLARKSQDSVLEVLDFVRVILNVRLGQHKFLLEFVFFELDELHLVVRTVSLGVGVVDLAIKIVTFLLLLLASLFKLLNFLVELVKLLTHAFTLGLFLD